MPEAAGLAELLASRALPAVVLASAVAALLWLAGLVVLRGALASLVALTGAFLLGSWPASILVAGALAAVGLVARLSAARVEPKPRIDRLDTAAVTGITAVTLVMLVAGAAGVPAGYAVAGAVGALLAAAATWLAARLAEVIPGPSYRLLPPRTSPSPGGGLTAPGLGAGLVLAMVLSWAAMSLHLLGAGEPALVLVGAACGISLTGVSPGAARASLGGLLLVSGIAAVTTTALAAFLP